MDLSPVVNPAEPNTPALAVSAAVSAMTRRQFIQWSSMLMGATALAATPWSSLVSPQASAQTTPLADKPAIQPSQVLRGSLPNTLLVIEPKSFTHLKDSVEGLSWNQLSQHIGLYEGYVKKLNQVHQALAQATAQKQFDQIRDLQLKQSFSLNGAVLHDLYFSNLGGQGTQIAPLTQTLIDRDFGSMDLFLADLTAVGAAMRGWAITGFNLMDGKLHNYGLDAHDVGTPASVVPILVLDVYEHAYMIDFGTKRADYLSVFARNIDWRVVDERLQAAMSRINVQDCVAC